MADTDCTYVFVGYSGDKIGGKTPKFETSEDPNGLYFLMGQTLANAIKLSFPSTRVIVKRAWKQSTVLEALTTPGDLPKPIRQIHFICHGGSWVLSLAYKYAGNSRIEAAAEKYFTVLDAVSRIAQPGDRQKLYLVMRTLEEMDPMVSGYLSRVAKPWELGGPAARAAQLMTGAKLRTDIKTRLMEDAYVHVWGCYSGEEFSSYASSTVGPVAQKFFKEVGSLFAGNPGIARELAIELEVPVTALSGTGGSGFLLPKDGGGVRPTRDPSKGEKADVVKKPPVYMWRSKPSEWVTWNPDGKRRANVVMFQKERKAPIDSGKQVGGGYIEPPSWYVDAHKKATLK